MISAWVGCFGRGTWLYVVLDTACITRVAELGLMVARLGSACSGYVCHIHRNANPEELDNNGQGKHEASVEIVQGSGLE